MYIALDEYIHRLNELRDKEPEMSGENQPEIGDEKTLKGLRKKHYDRMVSKLGTVSDGSNRNIISFESKEDLRRFVVYLINVSYFPTEDAPMWDIEAYLSFSLAEKAVSEPAFIKKQKQLSGLVSTHNVKMVNTDFAPIQYTLMNPVTSSPLHVSSADVKSVKSFDFVGGAPDAKSCQLIYTEFCYQGCMTGIFSAISGRDDALFEFVCDMGEQFKSFFEDLRAALQAATSKKSEASDLQILIPISDDGYVSLTPIVNIGFSRVFHDRVYGFKHKHEDRYLLTDEFIVGGTQPINAGKFNVSQSGRNKTMKALFPSFKREKHDRIINKYKRSESLFIPYLDDEIEFLRMPLKFSKQKEGFKRYLPMVLSSCLDDIFYARNLYEKGHLEDLETVNLNQFEKSLVQGGTLSSQDIEVCARKFVTHLLEKMNKEDSLYIGDEARMPYLIEAMRNLISEF